MNRGKEKKTCFVIAPIGREGSEDRKWSDQVMELIIKPAAEKFKYRVIRADHITDPGTITSQVIQQSIHPVTFHFDALKTGSTPKVSAPNIMFSFFCSLTSNNSK